ncbi:MAG: tetratricopeptide (TPR) repeat protein [Planctomycetota bacterium]
MTAIRSEIFAFAALALLSFGCSKDGGDGGSAKATGRAFVATNFVGTNVCAECHAAATEAWRGSHHDLAMQHATDETVLGDFDDAAFEHLGKTTRFSRQGTDFIVNAEGADGALKDFKVAYTFGVEPLQQYLLETEDGRLQSHTVAWDVERQEWYSLYPDEAYEPGDALHWTGIYQNWNSMCADCHSTGLVKGYDEANDRFETHYQEIDVACEACHGAGADHVDWARAGGQADDGSESNGLTHHLQRDQQFAQINTCAPCHSRRTPLAANLQPSDSFLDNYLPELLRPDSYHDDGQIKGEVYAYGSFAQSKMHASGVTCTDCHNPHTLELHFPDNALCAQCHSTNAPVERFPNLAKIDYDTPEHHQHEVGSPGASCVECHMPETTYMGIDPRRDHSLRVPRPDLSLAIGTPNACNKCHQDEDATWAADRVNEWFGPERDYHFGPVFTAARVGDPVAQEHLIGISRDQTAPAIIRATALELMSGAGETGTKLARSLLMDPNPLVRATAVRGLDALKPVERLDPLMPFLEDPSRAVRIEAARMLAGAPQQVLEAISDNYDKAIGDWRESQNLSAEMPWAHHNLGSLEQDLGNVSEAREQYQRAIEIDPHFLPSSFNLATLFNKAGRNLEAERVLRDAIKIAPNEGELHYSLGLLLAEIDRLSDAANSLVTAAKLMPWRPRIHYNAGLALQRAGRMEEAERELLDAERLQPDVPEVVHALAAFYVEEKTWVLALPYAERLVKLIPEAPWVPELIEEIRTGIASQK